MASKHTDPFDRRIRKPRSLKMAHRMGEATINAFKKITMDRHPDVVPTTEQEALVNHLGRAIGEEMFRDGAPWTLNQFINRLGKVTSAS